MFKSIVVGLLLTAAVCAGCQTSAPPVPKECKAVVREFMDRYGALGFAPIDERPLGKVGAVLTLINLTTQHNEAAVLYLAGDDMSEPPPDMGLEAKGMCVFESLQLRVYEFRGDLSKL